MLHEPPFVNIFKLTWVYLLLILVLITIFAGSGCIDDQREVKTWDQWKITLKIWCQVKASTYCFSCRNYFIILEPTGAGKNLLLKLITGFYFFDSGRILLDGKDVTFLHLEKNGLTFVYYNYLLFSSHESEKEHLVRDEDVKNKRS